MQPQLNQRLPSVHPKAFPGCLDNFDVPSQVQYLKLFTSFQCNMQKLNVTEVSTAQLELFEPRKVLIGVWKPRRIVQAYPFQYRPYDRKSGEVKNATIELKRSQTKRFKLSVLLVCCEMRVIASGGDCKVTQVVSGTNYLLKFLKSLELSSGQCYVQGE